jgi:UPF0755 protein
MDPGAYEGADMPAWRASDGRGGPPRGRRHDLRRRSDGGLPGLLRFFLFAGILGIVVVIAGLTAFRPLVRAAIVHWAWDNVGSLKVGFVADFVREDLGAALKDPASADASEVVFQVELGDTPASLAPRLLAGGLIASERAFIFTATVDGLAARLKAGSFLLRKDMTPQQVVTALVDAPVVIKTLPVTFREGLRLEQITAKLETLTSGVDPKQFYDEVTRPPASLLADFPWLKLPDGATLEGYLYPATYTLVTSASGDPLQHVTTADDLVRAMLKKFHDVVGDERMAVPKDRGLTWTEVLTMASMVQLEAGLDVDRPLIAGVFQNRLDNPRMETRGLLQSDPTIAYVNDTLELQKLPFDSWQLYSFWNPIKTPLPADLPADLAGYNTYTHQGLPPGPLVSPTVASIDAALSPDTSTGYFYFLAVGDGTTVYAKTKAEHDKNVAKYLK